MQVDAVRKIISAEKIAARKLADLRARKISVARSARQNLLSSGKRALLRFGLILPRGWQSKTRAFIVAASIVLLLLSSLQLLERGNAARKRILGEATTALDYLNSGKTSILREDFASAERELKLAEQGFSAIGAALPFKNTPLGAQAELLLALGQQAARALNKLSSALGVFEDTRLAWDSVTNSADQSFYLGLKDSREKLQTALAEINAALVLYGSVEKTLLPEDVAGEFEQAGSDLVAGQRAMGAIADLMAFVMNVLGGEPKTYLLIFQNNNEARATGGFIGTYGIVRFENGRVFLDRIESIYNLDGQLRERIAAPGPMQRELTPTWGIRDANWFADFPASARKILEFFEKETGRKADGILSFTPDVFERLLRLTGPVPMPGYGLTLTEENFRAFAQYKTSVDYDRVENQPKKFLADFAPLFLERLEGLDQGSFLGLLQALSELISQKHILMYSSEPDLQARVQSYHLGGEILRTDGDYLAILSSNVGGGKTDLSIRQQVLKEVVIDDDGTATVHLAITRTQDGYDEKNLPRNLNFMRILVPRDSRIIAASGFEGFPVPLSSASGAATDPDLAAWDSAAEESGYTEFRFWQELRPGESKTLDLTYRLPGKVTGKYTMLLQKQAGAPAFHFRLEVQFPRAVAYSYPEEFSGMVSGDRLYGVVGK
ncbi:MAG: DUF4012 domain-containing protein [Candidatus Doudnabacteria bacterium]|nr:DUF4012 domain-containing protein [Candidatus Doudnabacteria bacterium]